MTAVPAIPKMFKPRLLRESGPAKSASDEIMFLGAAKVLEKDSAFDTNQPNKQRPVPKVTDQKKGAHDQKAVPKVMEQRKDMRNAPNEESTVGSATS